MGDAESKRLRGEWAVETLPIKHERVTWTVTRIVTQGHLDCIVVNSLNALFLCPGNLHEDGFKSNELVFEGREISRQVNIQL